ncbi:MAG: HAD hydrolase-like protein [Trueperella sp.]|nr:HAD hydrolase-like protein [Trueperella sp.]
MKVAIFDLDGTVANSGPIIRKALATTMKEMAGIEVAEADLQQFVGPPLSWSLQQLGAPASEVYEYEVFYRQYYSSISANTDLFPGFPEVFTELHDAGVGVALATSKKQKVAEQVCAELGIIDYFDVLCGSSDITAEKYQVVGAALAGMEAGGWLDPAERRVEQTGLLEANPAQLRNLPQQRTDVVMVGDRIYDVRGAAVYQIPTIFVGWAEAPAEEFSLAWKIADDAEELVDLIIG